MTIDQTLSEVLDETIEALTNLDSAKLHTLEQRIIALADDKVNYDGDSISSVLPKRRQLEIILQNFQVNLDALTRLYARNMRNQWAQSPR
jgi:hypothetical protein